MPILVTGGARSGKSNFAEQLSARLGSQGVYVATAQIYDEEMRERVAMHLQQREQSGFKWHTLEEPYMLSSLLHKLDAGDLHQVVLVDCMTLWLSNHLLQAEGEADASAQVMERMKELVQAVAAFKGQLVLVTNEVGSGIVPEYPLGRQYRDLAGKLNQQLAAVCEQVFLVTAGIPIELKSRAYKLGE